MGLGNLRHRLGKRIIPQSQSDYDGRWIGRCTTDSLLVTYDNLEDHLGHYVKQPVILSWWEKFMLHWKLI